MNENNSEDIKNEEVINIDIKSEKVINEGMPKEEKVEEAQELTKEINEKCNKENNNQTENNNKVNENDKNSSYLGTCSLIIGIGTFLLAFVPMFGITSYFIAPIGIILGIISLIKKNEKIKSVLGIVFSSIAFIMAVNMTILAIIFEFFNIM